MILSLNAGGLRKRLNTPEWEETISSYDIVCIQETHFDAFDSLDIPGFKCLPLITRNNAKVRSGGLAILVREHLYDSIKILESEGDHFYWFTLINHFPQDIAFCCVYIAPEGSNCSNIDYIDSLEADILYFASHNYKFCLLGDFNAHTNNELDFTCVDDNIQQSLNIGNAIDNNLGFCPLEELGFSKERHNSDLSHIDNFGKRLLELCKSCGLCIGNGRLGRDRSLGCKTCKGVTVVDYVILSPSLFPYVSEFEVLPFDPMISDAHSGVHFSLICNEIDLHVNQGVTANITMAKWNNAEAESFVEHLNTDKIASFLHKIDVLDIDQVAACEINDLNAECSSILIGAARDVGFIKDEELQPPKKNCKLNTRPVQRPWFNNECQRLRRQYKRAKNLRHRINNAENYKFVHNASKAYKKCINKQFNLHKKDFIAKLRSLKHSDPKSYWSLLNKADNSRSQVVQKVSLESFADHFKKLNIANTTDTDSTFQIDPSKVSEHNFELNSAISEDEVLKCLNHLKLNKACSSDLILNEFLKSSKTKMLTVFTTFFNLVFNTGIIPDEWSQGMISPIYKNKGHKASPDNYRGITILSCFGKLFTAILNNRLNNYLESMNLLCEEQAGFRKKYGTTDHIFNLKCIIDLYLFRGKNYFAPLLTIKKPLIL